MSDYYTAELEDAQKENELLRAAVSDAWEAQAKTRGEIATLSELVKHWQESFIAMHAIALESEDRIKELQTQIDILRNVQ